MILLRLEAKIFSRVNNTNIVKKINWKVRFLKKGFIDIQAMFQFISDLILGTKFGIFFK